eukprot:CAMPEP_0173406392 /NCGR_PEP_ID=MMETSP1356-20130122/64509_1 /TAXON_ID=77927 ORGANISM="Hemiselmis virescens, Strain PCC157" /NCGR_SAMPLE_ID=MMETSP1356 /ASSEMBLY_ACC=CAM_ASM_000847 /LENGTH=59 /DNA_ID=CAMNT_0014367377 /DNA_START=9 /DNA_END=185 /DNA_ORIENTATION=+
MTEGVVLLLLLLSRWRFPLAEPGASSARPPRRDELLLLSPRLAPPPAAPFESILAAACK